MSRQYSYNLIAGAQVADNLSAPADKFNALVKTQPTSEYQIRPLAILEPDQQCEVWEEAVRSADGKVATYKLVNDAVTELIGPSPTPPPPEKKKKEEPHPDAVYFAMIAIIQPIPSVEA
jgi:hypothetical protein